MGIGMLAGLGALALVDSTSFGTLVIPVFLMLTRTPVVRRMLVYLGTVAGFYFVVGVALLLGLMPLVEKVGALLETRVFRWGELAAGAGLVWLSFRLDPKRRRADRAARTHARIAAVGDSSMGMAALGVTAASLEVATMFPYLAAIGLLLSADLSPAVWVPTLAAYNFVMVLPALVLLALRLAAAERIRGPLDRLGNWLSRHSASALSWTVFLIGIVVARDAVIWLWFSNR